MNFGRQEGGVELTAAQPLSWGDLQPRYYAYCIAHEAITPQEMLERDTAAYPGGKMSGYIIWISQRWRAWQKLNGRASDGLLSENDHADFSDWVLVEALRRQKNVRLFDFYETPSEVTDSPTIVRDDPQGGDPHTVAVLSRVHRPEAVRELCELANFALTARSVLAAATDQRGRG